MAVPVEVEVEVEVAVLAPADDVVVVVTSLELWPPMPGPEPAEPPIPLLELPLCPGDNASLTSLPHPKTGAARKTNANRAANEGDLAKKAIFILCV